MATTYIIGRKGHIFLNDKAVSRHHATLKVSQNEIRLTDSNSANGLYLVKNGRLIRFHDGFVQLNQLIVIGSKQYTISQLLEKVQSYAA